MSKTVFPLLDPLEEDELHAKRLLSVDERPFHRVSNRLLGKDAMIRSYPTQLATPPPDSEDAGESATTQTDIQKQEQDRRQWRDDVLVDFQLLESMLVRMQLLKDSNERERERYAAEKSKIMETAQAVRDNTIELRAQLEEAQTNLALRKTYDELTIKITSDRTLKPRDEQQAQLDKLKSEIADLELEGNDFGITWDERKVQFGRITSEGAQMMRLIRGEKDEPDKDEGMDDVDEGEASTTKAENSRTGTPRPDAGASTPLPSSVDGDEPTSQLKPLPKAKGLGVATPLLGGSRAGSPGLASGEGNTPAAGKDTEMVDEPTPQTGPASDDLEEGETGENSVADGEQMDVT